ncbi:MAG: LIM domain-containing protein [Ignavibacteriales bacterium]|nr:LIM domain-containing protein [Ignavibacteriales bacterium]
MISLLQLNRKEHHSLLINTLLIFLFLLTLNSNSNAQEKLYCHTCGSVITGKYLRVDNYNYHPEHFICSVCGKQIIGDYYKDNGKYYHKECEVKTKGLYCAYCNKILVGEYFVYENKKYHESCYENYILPKCSICNAPLKGVFNIDIYGNKYHKEHSAELNKCECCGRLICQALTGGGIKYPDGRNICNLCRRDAVFDQYQFKELLSIVSSRLVSFGIIVDMKRISILGVDKKFLTNKFKGAGELGQGYCDSQTRTQYENDKLVSNSTSHIIYVLNGVSKISVEATIAHELMHAWMLENTNGDHPDNIREGSSNYVSYLFLNSINDPAKNDQMKIIEKNSDPVYGGGFRYIFEKFDGKPVAEFLKYLKN